MDADIQNQVATYKPNLDVLRAMASIELLATVGPTASGKTTIMNALVASDQSFAQVKDETTRAPRQGEAEGVDFLFKTREQVLADMRTGALVQVALGPNGDFYCTRPSSYPPGGIGLLALVPPAVQEFRRLPIKKFSTAFIVPASFEAWQNWLKAQAQSGEWDEAKLAGRMAEAAKSFEFALSDSQTKFVLNDDIKKAAERLRQVGFGQAPDDEDQARQAAQDNYLKLSTLITGK